MAYHEAITALGDPTRRTVFEELLKGPTPVGELAQRLPVSRPAVSQHLRVLKDAGLVRDRRDGTRRLYSLNGDGIAELRVYLDGFWEVALDAFKAAADNADDERGDDDE